MLGIDINNEVIRLVCLHRRGGKAVLEGVLQTPIAADQADDAQAAGLALEHVIRRHHPGWIDEPAVMLLDASQGMVRRFPADRLKAHLRHGRLQRNAADILTREMARMFLAPAEQMVFDIDYHRAEEAGTLLIGAANKTEVEFYRRVASTAGLRLERLELRSMAAMNGILSGLGERRQDSLATLYVERQQVQAALLDTPGPVRLASFRFEEPLEDSAGASYKELIEQLRQLLNTMRLGQEPLPECVLLSCGGEFDPGEERVLAEHLERDLEMPVSLTEPEAGLTISAAAVPPESLRSYQPALGAALHGLGFDVRGFNFLHPHGTRHEKRAFTSWRTWLALTGVVVLAVMVFFIYLVGQRRARLHDIQEQIALWQPKIEQIEKSQKNWNLFRTYLPADEKLSAAQTGSRLSMLDILCELTRLFPDTQDAYITELLLGQNKSGLWEITITGNVRQSEFHTAFINRLLDSELFRDPRQAGPLLQVADNVLYPYSFSITCTLRRSTGATP